MAEDRSRGRPVAYIIMGVVVVFTILPVFWVISISFKSSNEWFARPVHWLPQSPTISNYLATFRSPSAIRAISNSLIVSFCSTGLALLMGFPAAYVISRYRAGRFASFVVPFILRASPPIVLAIPLLVFYSSIGLLDSLGGLTLVYGATTVFYVIWMVKPFIDAVPEEVEEAAMVDGVATWRIPFGVILPIVVGGLAAATIFVFILNWTEFVLSLALTNLQARTIPIEMTTITSLYSVAGYGQAASVSTVSLLPFMAVAYYFQKQLIRTFSLGRVGR